LSAYQKALEVREMLEGLNSPSVADVYDSIACSYTEQGNVNDAFKYLSKSAEIHNARNPLLMGRTQAIYAMTYLQTWMPEKALAALDHCWKLQNLTEEQVIQSRYPKHSGDIILLSRIKYVQGLKQEAQQLASRTITIRRGLFGDKGHRVADSTFIVARMLEAGNEDILAAKLLRAVAEMSKGVPEMQGHFARSLWFLAMVEDKIGDKTMAEQLRIDAKKERDKITGRETADSDTDDSFMKLVPWMLW
jgi:tetratricopeptide (TPR) repeat protein